jgi:hypothetical protein
VWSSWGLAKWIPLYLADSIRIVAIWTEVYLSPTIQLYSKHYPPVVIDIERRSASTSE